MTCAGFPEEAFTVLIPPSEQREVDGGILATPLTGYLSSRFGRSAAPFTHPRADEAEHHTTHSDGGGAADQSESKSLKIRHSVNFRSSLLALIRLTQ